MDVSLSAASEEGTDLGEIVQSKRTAW